MKSKYPVNMHMYMYKILLSGSMCCNDKMLKCLVKAAARFTIKNIAACKMLLLIIKVALGVCFPLKSWKEYM